ncbi:GAF domain-containing sensor histidine kinase [Arsukibacterium sp.]|uniref:GAF domain-containing sensor histidine kinase n=1 Tax=Arsukibacterium sp. TaxID=1977258 RepID=UPI00299E60FB|nr:GAF domain-containing sensor histidine kinase [Arsukibacterium sp.]MDX1676480.1 GAF domain-containing sensor histidine kinase [Arsukibacterium sp.]
MDTTLETILLNVSLSPVLDSGDSDAAELLLLQACLNGLKIARVSLWCFDSQRKSISCEQLLDNELPASSEKAVFYRQDFPAYFSALDHQRVIRANDACSHPATSEFTQSYLIPSDIVSMLDVPIRFGGEMIGVICCEQKHTLKKWTDDETHFVAALADLYGRALTARQKKQYQQQLEQLNQQLERRVNERTEQLEKHIDELQQTQAQLVESEKMASLGALVAGVAHEVNTPLGIAITANSHCIEMTDKLQQLLESNTLSRSKLETTIQALRDSHAVIERTLDRSAELVVNFKKTAVDQSSYDIQTINLADYIGTLVTTLKPYTKAYDVDHQIHCRQSITITTYPGAIAQVITNLVINACMHAFEQTKGTNKVEFLIEQPQRETVQLTVRDNGKGIAKAEQKRIFEPFYTTKRSNGGSGLGLAIVYNLVANTLGGAISIDSTPGHGSSFRLTLPIVCPEVTGNKPD